MLVNEMQSENTAKAELMLALNMQLEQRGKVKHVSSEAGTTFNARIGEVYAAENANGTIPDIHSPSFPSKEWVPQ